MVVHITSLFPLLTHQQTQDNVCYGWKCSLYNLTVGNSFKSLLVRVLMTCTWWGTGW